jgi:tetratricopeptide (TPR) repeat protein
MRRFSAGLILSALGCIPSICVLVLAYGLNSQAESLPVDEARDALLRHDYARAEALYRSELLKQPASAELLTDLGIALHMQGRATEAIRAFEQALKQKYFPRTFGLLAEERCISRDYDEARPMLKRILQEDAQNPDVLALVAPCYLDADLPLQAVEVYRALLRDSAYPHDLALIQLAKSYLAATQFFCTRLAAKPEGATYRKAIEQAQKSGDARAAFNDAQRASPYFRPDMPFGPVLSLWSHHPDDAALLYQLAVLSGEESMEQVVRCNQSFPDSPYLAQLNFEMLADQGKTDTAISGFEALLKSHPELPELRFDLGMLYRKLRMWDKALAVFHEELSGNPDDERAAARISEALDQLTRWNELRDFLEPRIRQKDPPLWASLDMAEALEQSGDRTEAIRVLLAAESRFPASRAVHFRLLHLYRLSGDMPRAVAESRWFKNPSE